MIKLKDILEGTCGYGLDGELGDEPAGPHLLKKKKKDEGIGDYFSKKISKHGGTRNKAEIENIAKYLMKKGDNKKDALDKIKQNYDYVSKKYRSASVSKKADILTSLQESVDEGMTKQQADITLKQLGGNKFIAMTGAKQFSFGKQGLGFRIGKNSKICKS